MTAITPITRQKIKAYLEIFINDLVEAYKGRRIREFSSAGEYLASVSSEGDLKPFHASIISPSIMRINQFERGLSTRLGTTFEECARLIALDHHFDAQRSWDVRALVSASSWAEVEVQVARLDRGARELSGVTIHEMVQSILDKRREDDLVEHIARADLFIRRKDGTELYFEIKSPKPNKGQCLEVMQRILRIHAIRQMSQPLVQAFYGMAYNPWGYGRSSYRWGYPQQYMDFDNTVVIGEEFWSLIGGPTTYHELLEIYREVGAAKEKYIVDSLAFGF